MKMDRITVLVLVPGFAACLLGCPGGGAGDEEVGESSETGGETDGDTGGDGDGDGGAPTCPNSLPNEYVAGQFDIVELPSFAPSEDDFAQLKGLCDPAQADYGWAGDPIEWNTVNGDGVDLVVYRPADGADGEWPDGQFPLVFHHHGNGGQDGAKYRHIADAVVDDGAIFVSVGDARGGEPDLRAMINICMLRWLFTADDWDLTRPGTGGASRLDGNIVVMGHSNGGEGAHIVYNWFEERPWDGDQDAPEHDMRLCGVVGLSPRGAEASNAPFSSGIGVDGPATVPYLTIEGSIDNDVPGGSLWNSSYSGLDERHGPTDAAKVSVWVYDAEHDSFGGGGQILMDDVRSGVLGVPNGIQLARGEFVVETWLDVFVRRFMFGDTSVEPVLYGHEQPLGLDEQWWDYHPAWDGAPLLFVSSEPHQSAAAGEHGVRQVVDTMQRADELTCIETEIVDGASTTSEGTPFSANNWPAGTLRTDCALNLASYASTGEGRYDTLVLRANYTAAADDVRDPIERTLTWGVDELDMHNAAVFSFRASNIDEVDYPGPGMGCSPVDGDPTNEVQFDIVFVSGDDVEVTVRSSDYARLLDPDIFEVSTPGGGAFLCPASHFLQTVRVPLDEVLCPSFPPEELREVRFEFDRLAAPEGHAVLLDTVEFHRELSGAPVCG